MRQRSSPKGARGEGLRGIAAAAKAFESFRPARDVLSVVRAVPTRFVQFDHATLVGGLPIERFMLAHGPSGEGKTALSLGLLDSFLIRDHYGMLIDAERTTPFTWADAVMKERAHLPTFFALRPNTYEETVETVRKFVLTLKAQRDAGNIPPETSALIVCDSIRKLVPEGLLKKLFGEVKKGEKKPKGIDGMGGRAAQIKAAMNSQWLDELVPLLEETQTAFIAIARETEDPDADSNAKMWGNNFKVGGGKAIYYDASMVMRVERAGWVQEKFGEGDKARAKVYGERHCITIRKTKVSGHEEKQTRCYFHTSNGVLTPFGFDRGRDVLDIGERFGLIERAGSWYAFNGQKIGNGQHQAAVKLAQDTDLLDEIEMAVREQFKRTEPLAIDDDGVVE